MGGFNFDAVRQKLEQSKREVLIEMSNQAQNYFVKSFKTQSFDGKPWKEVQRRTEGTNAFKYPKSKGLQRRTSPILVGAGYKKRGGTLLKAVSNMSKTSTVRGTTVRMIVDLPYASVHNEGNCNIPKRTFVGQTAELTKMQSDKLTKIINRIWQV